MSFQGVLIQIMLSTVLNFRFIGFSILVVVLIVSLFNWHGAKITNELLVLCGFIFLGSVFSELKSWNLWGFKGEKRDLSVVPDSGAIDSGQSKPNEKDVNKAENQPIQLMENGKGNFLTLAFEIERLLRVLGTVSLVKDIPSTTNPKRLVDDLYNIGMLTDNGRQQIEAVRWLRNILVHGRDSEINAETLNQGIRIASSLYTEIFNWLNKTNIQNEK